jgi:integrase
MEKIVTSMSPKSQPLGWILAETGIDVSEAINLKWDDFKNGVLVLPRNKTGIPRKVYLTNKVKSILREQSRFRILGEEQVFPDIDSRSGLTKSFVRAVKKSGPGRNVRLKDLSHYFGSTYKNAGVNSIIVVQMMGQADIGMLHRNYGHVSNEGLKNAKMKVSVLGEQ